jgi:hypothetical protein
MVVLNDINATRHHYPTEVLCARLALHDVGMARFWTVRCCLVSVSAGTARLSSLATWYPHGLDNLLLPKKIIALE